MRRTRLLPIRDKSVASKSLANARATAKAPLMQHTAISTIRFALKAIGINFNKALKPYIAMWVATKAAPGRRTILFPGHTSVKCANALPKVNEVIAIAAMVR